MSRTFAVTSSDIRAMKSPPFLLIIAMLCALCPAVFAQESPQQLLDFRISPEGTGNWFERSTEDGKNKQKLSDERVEKEIYPAIKSKAEQGKFPEVWMIGYFYLDDNIIPKDLEQAEAAFRKGLDKGNPTGMVQLAHYHQVMAVKNRSDKAQFKEHHTRSETLYLELLKAKHKQAIQGSLWAANSRLNRWYGAERDNQKTRELLSEILQLAPNHTKALSSLARLAMEEKDYAKAYEHSDKAYQLLKDSEDEKQQAEFKQIQSIRFSAAYLSGNADKIDPNEAWEIIGDTFKMPKWLAWSIPALSAIWLMLLVFLTYRKGAIRPGMVLSIAWILAIAFIAGIGFIITLPGLENMAGKWIGAILLGVAALLAVLICDRKHYLGERPLTTTPARFLKTLGLLVAIVLGINLVTIGYSKIYELLLGSPPAPQMVGLLMKSDSLPQILLIILLAGIVIPFYEEVIFRGFFYDALDKKWGVKRALIISSIVFALIHGFVYALPIFFLSLALGWLRIKTGNLKLSFLLHALNNSLAVIGMNFWGW